MGLLDLGLKSVEDLSMPSVRGNGRIKLPPETKTHRRDPSKQLATNPFLVMRLMKSALPARNFMIVRQRNK